MNQVWVAGEVLIDLIPEGFEDMQRRVPDISKIKRVLGWSPEINLDQIIKDIAAFNSK